VRSFWGKEKEDPPRGGGGTKETSVGSRGDHLLGKLRRKVHLKELGQSKKKGGFVSERGGLGDALMRKETAGLLQKETFPK